MLAAELGSGHQQAADERQVRMAQRELRPAQARNAAADDGEFLARTRLGGVGQERVLDVRHGPSLGRAPFGAGAPRRPLRRDRQLALLAEVSVIED